MNRIAYLASQVTIPGSPIRRSDAWEHDLMMAALRPAFAVRGMQLEDVCWDAPGVDWSDYRAAIIGTTWDYWDRLPDYLAALRHIGSLTELHNPAALIDWNVRKTYLRELETRGARLIPTLWLDHCGEAEARAAFDVLDSDTLVFKRQVGAGADGQHRLRRGEPIPQMPHPMMVQPYLPMIEREGELSFVFIDGAFSHALLKRAKPGDYRIQSSYGGSEAAIDPDPADLVAAAAILEALDTPPLYGRVDMLRGEDGGLLLMELELVEPYLYPEQGPQLGELLATALQRRLRGGLD